MQPESWVTANAFSTTDGAHIARRAHLTARSRAVTGRARGHRHRRLDGARLLARVLPPRAQIVYRNLDQYLVLFTLVIFFVFAGPLLSIVNGLIAGAAGGAFAVATVM